MNWGEVLFFTEIGIKGLIWNKGPVNIWIECKAEK